ncbi:MAG: hypothetical protein JWR77_1739 [Rhizorhabdus sp.]|nr:hypothetical protein [Rhizorhabdus sp.]
MRLLILMAAFGLSGAATAKPLFPQGTALPPPADAAPACSATSARGFIGKSGDGNAEAARQAADAEAVRLIRPGQAVSQDYRVERLNLKLDDKGVVVAITCG